MHWSDEFFNECQEPRYSSIAQSLDVREEHFRNHMWYARHQIRAALTQPSLRDCNVRVYMQKAAAQQDAWARCSVRRGAAGKVASMQ